MEQGLLTTKQVAALLDVSVATVNRLAVSGALPVAYEVPLAKGARFYRPEDVTTYRNQTKRRAS